MKNYIYLAYACIIVLLSTAPTFAMASWFPHGRDGGPPVSHSAPGPVLGVGVPAAIALGGYIWYRRRRRRR
jgi:hypothetical protein